MKEFGTVITKMITPFDENGKLNFSKTKELVEYLIENGTDSLLVGAETRGVDWINLKHYFRFVRKTAKGRVKVIGDITMVNPTDIEKMVEKLCLVPDVDAIMLRIPYTYEIDQGDIKTYVKSIAKLSKIPLFIYNNPGETGVTIEPETVIALSEIQNVVAIQDSSGDMSAISEIMVQKSKDFYVYSGKDQLTFPIVSLGGDGVISVSSHIYGKEIKNMIRYLQRNQSDRARKIHQHLFLYFKEFNERGPNFIKNVLKNNEGLDMGKIKEVHRKTEKENEEYAKMVFGNIH